LPRAACQLITRLWPGGAFISYVAGLMRKKAGNVRPAADGAAFVQPPFTSTMFIYLNQVRRVRERAGRFACGFLSSKTIRI
jgi:hypothetical protein